ncbi:hypothetical protein ACI3KW_00465 [Devosia sp. ZW T5_3]|uniref:hypothetical protein n=1 Tax=Devosia sp. ZW T5_3 TaxID=3378085 RepID=UPI003853F3EA
MKDEFEYDVAFSFTAQDEALASQLNDLVSDRLKTFIYSERQKELAGTDGQTTFSDVYGKQARVVVILFRKEWGQTRWTGVELNAIRSRAFEQGFDFTVFIPVEPTPATPAWLPPTRLYVGLERWGVAGAAAVIEQRVIDAGGFSRPESVIERAARLKRATDLKNARHQFERSHEGTAQANAAYTEFSEALDAGAETVRASGVNLEYKTSQHFRIVTCYPVNLICSWSPNYVNSIENIDLDAAFYKGFPGLPGFYPSFNKAVQLAALKFKYALVRMDQNAYVSKDAKEFTPEKLAEHLLSQLMDIVERTPRD